MGVRELCVLVGLLASVAAQSCPLHWTGFTSSPGSKCYRFFGQDKQSWDDARRICQVHGGDLLQIDNAQERTWVENQVKGLGESNHRPSELFWSGLNNKEVYTTWQWAQGAAVASNVINWQPGKPTPQAGTFSCAGIIPQAAKFQDRPCTQANFYVCSRERGVPLKCDADHGWQTLNGKCYKLHFPGSNWDSAVNTCNHDGGSLVSIDSLDEEKAVHTFAINNRQPLWIGLHSLKTGTNSFTWQTLNGTAPTTTYWHQAPSIDQAHLNTTCAMISNSFPAQQDWATSPCSSRRGFVCRKPEGMCQPGWIGHRAYCYQFDTQYTATFSEANTYCRNQGSELLRIEDGNVESFITSFIDEIRGSGVSGFWIGASDDNINGGPFKWRNGQVINGYKFWAAHGNNPPNTQGSQDCAFISAADSGGKWLTDNHCQMRRAFVCRIPMNVAVKIPPQTPQPHFGCPTNWRLYQTTCLKVTEKSADWLTSRSLCKATPGADLVKITNANMQTFINNGMNLPAGSYWIGLNDRTSDGVFVWNDETTPTSYTNWAPHEPNNYGPTGENCVALWTSHKWNDARCSTVIKGICSKPANTPFVTPFPPTQPADYSVKCGPGWVSNPSTNNCYMLVDDQLSWQDAGSLCRNSGGDLTAIETIEEQNFLAGQLKSLTSLGVWIGANDINTESGWSWSNTQPFAFLNWAPGSPGQGADGQSTDCVVMYTRNALWDDVNCQNRNGFICEKQGSLSTPRTTPKTTPRLPAGMVLGCPEHWMPFRDNCYRFFRSPVNYQTAITNCGINRGILASIHDRDENNFIAGNLPTPVHSWDGYWIGLNDQQIDMRFQWTDGTVVGYTNWLAGEPNNYQNHREDCVMIRMNNGKWNDDRCENVQPGFVCKQPKVAVSATQAPYQQGCPEFALGYGPFCYQFRADTRNFNGAQHACQSAYNGTLATVNDRILQAFLASQMVWRTGNFWIGLSDVGHPTKYSWQTGEALQYTNWFTTHTGNERSTCVTMRTASPTGLWENSACSAQNGFLCQFHRQGWTLPPTTPTPFPNVNCPNGWTANYDVCIRAFRTTPQTWANALLYCKNMGGTLASFHNNRNDSALSAFPSTTYWIGFNDQGTEGQFRWADGSASDYTNWNQGEPNNLNNEDCVVYAVQVRGWVDFPCTSNNAYICQINRGVTPSPAPVPTHVPSSSQCSADGNWYLYNNNCYRLPPNSGPNATLNWYDAGAFCSSNGGSLASIHSQAELNYIINLIQSLKSDNGVYFIGLNDLNSDGFHWSDGSSVDYVKWNPNEPNDWNGERCVHMTVTTGGWNDLNCDREIRYLCKKPLHPPASTPSPTPYPAGGCANGFTIVPGGRNKCFYLGGRLDSKRLNYTAAYDFCKKFGSRVDLASIEDMYEQEFLILMAKGLQTDIWIGLESLHYGKFVWQDNAQLSFTNWDRGEPTSDHNRQANTKCVSVRMYAGHEGKWTDEDCGQPKSYMCQSIQDPNILVPSNPNFCRTGYVPYNSACYKVGQEAKVWADALADCNNDGGSLTSVLDVFENAFVATLLRQTAGYWIGLSDTMIKGLYGWTDKWPVRYTNWGYNEPSYGPETANGACVVMNLNGKWNDSSCSRQLRYVCKISTASPPTATVPPPGSCPDPSTMLPVGDYCYYLSVNQGRSWPEADFQCRRLGMQLASVHSKEEMDSILNLATQAKVTNQQFKPNIWLGLSKGPTGAFMWNDNSQLNFLYWSPGEPTTLGVHGNQEECIEFDRGTGTWNSEDCFTNRGYVCKTPIVLSSTPYPVSVAGGVTPKPLPGNDSLPIYIAPTDGIPNRPGQGSTLLPNIDVPPGFVSGPPQQQQQQISVNTKTNNLGLSTGGIVGVVIAGVLLMAGGGILLIYLKRRGTIQVPLLNSNDESLGFDNALYSKNHESISIGNDNADVDA